MRKPLRNVMLIIAISFNVFTTSAQVQPGCETCPSPSPQEIEMMIQNHQSFVGKSNLEMPESFKKSYISQKSALSNKGTDFWVLFMLNYDNKNLNIFLDITSDETTSGTVSIPGLSWSEDFDITANQITRIQIPLESLIPKSGEVGQLGIHITSEKDVAVYGTNQREFSTDSFLGLPVGILGTQYLVMSYYGFAFSENASQFAIVSPYDNNTVTITPSQETRDGNIAGEPFNITLNKGETYLVGGALVHLNDLTGSVIQSTLPVSVFSGAACTTVPMGYNYCDHLVQQIPPISAWGKDFITRPLQGRNFGDTWRFLASQDNTVIYINNVEVMTLGFGDFYETVLTQPSLVKADKPILAVQYANGNNWDGASFPGDPFMMMIPPYQQFLSSYTFATPAAGFENNFFTVTVANNGVPGMLLDGVSLIPESFSQIGETGFSTASFPIDINSSYSAINSGGYPFGLYVYGFNRDDSYGYPGGLSLVTLHAGGGPQISLPQTTIEYFCTSNVSSVDLVISALVTDDIEPLTQQVTLFYRLYGEPEFLSVPMTNTGNNLWTGTISSEYTDFPGIEFYIQATDGQTNSSSPAVSPATNAYFIAIDNFPPQIIHTPVIIGTPGGDINILAEITDNTDSLASARLYFRITGGTPLYTVIEMTNIGNTYAAVIPGSQFTSQGVEYFIKATDNYGASCTYGSIDMPVHVYPGYNMTVNFLSSSGALFPGGSLLINETNHVANDKGVIKAFLPGGQEVSLELNEIPKSIFINWEDPEKNILSTQMQHSLTMPVNDIVLNAIFDSSENLSEVLTDKITIFPNPARDAFSVSSSVTMSKIKVINLTGSVVLETFPDGNHSQINMAALPQGIYLVQIYTGEKTITRRIHILK
jgi:hypothetical protein